MNKKGRRVPLRPMPCDWNVWLRIDEALRGGIELRIYSVGLANLKRGFGGAGFSLWVLNLARTNLHRLKPAPQKAQAKVSEQEDFSTW
jgi:hypothetical protein